jgi:hypothetical protein
MVFGMSLATYTLLHVVISLIGIASGVVVMYGFLNGKSLNSWAAIFLTSTALTSITGFGFPFTHLLRSHKVGIVSLIVLAVTIPARYLFHLAGGWRRIYVIGSTIAFYFNVFVLVVQSFMKVPPLHALAPTQTEAPFAVAQLLVLAAFVVLGTFAVKRFRPASVRMMSRAA